ncbi:MAG: methylglyoxal synthase [Chloroflexota bacterium]
MELPSTPSRMVLVVLADDESKSDAIEVLRTWRSRIESWKIVATRETGNLIEARLALDVELVESGARGGTYQIAALVVSKQVAAVIGLSQRLSRTAETVALTALREVCDIHNVPYASNTATAEAVMAWLLGFVDERVAVETDV